MTSRQRFGILLMTSTLVGAFCLPALAIELSPAQVGTAAPAPVSPAPAKAVKPAHPIHRVSRAASPAYQASQRPIEVASSDPTPAPSTSMACRYCTYPSIFGIAY
jgi:hypothetical protein